MQQRMSATTEARRREEAMVGEESLCGSGSFGEGARAGEAFLERRFKKSFAPGGEEEGQAGERAASAKEKEMKEEELFWQRYELKEEAAVFQGVLTVVRLAVDRWAGGCVAIKSMDKSLVNNTNSNNNYNNKALWRMRQEASVLKQLRGHANVVEFVDFLETGSHLHLVTRYTGHGDLYHYLYPFSPSFPVQSNNSLNHNNSFSLHNRQQSINTRVPTPTLPPHHCHPPSPPSSQPSFYNINSNHNNSFAHTSFAHSNGFAGGNLVNTINYDKHNTSNGACEAVRREGKRPNNNHDHQQQRRVGPRRPHRSMSESLTGERKSFVLPTLSCSPSTESNVIDDVKAALIAEEKEDEELMISSPYSSSTLPSSSSAPELLQHSHHQHAEPLAFHRSLVLSPCDITTPTVGYEFPPSSSASSPSSFQCCGISPPSSFEKTIAILRVASSKRNSNNRKRASQPNVAIPLPSSSSAAAFFSPPLNRMREEDARRVFRQLVAALEHCHSHNIAHLDLKPENVFLEDKLQVRLGDFGLCRLFSDGEHPSYVDPGGLSLPYSPPEILQRQPYLGPEVDMWSLGVLLYEMLCGRTPFQGVTAAMTIRNIINGRYCIPPFVSRLAADLIHSLLQTDTCQRLSLHAVAIHPWLLIEDDSDVGHSSHHQLFPRSVVFPSSSFSSVVSFPKKTKMTFHQSSPPTADGDKGEEGETLRVEADGMLLLKSMSQMPDGFVDVKQQQTP